MNSDLIGILVVLRMVSFLMLIIIVLVSNLFVGLGAFIIYLLTGILFFAVGLQITRSTLKLEGTSGIFGPFVGVVGFVYTVGAITNANALALALGNGFTPSARILYAASLVFALIIKYVTTTQAPSSE